MPVPALEKTWSFLHTFVQQAGNARDCNRAGFFAIKEGLKSLPVPWTVVGSSDASTAGLDGVDRIVTASKWIAAPASSAHSWIVLREPVSGLEVMFNAATASAAYEAACVVSIAPAGFSGAVTTITVPTGGSVLADLNAGTAPVTLFGALVPSSLFPVALHFIQSTDGRTTHVIACVGGVATRWFMFSDLADPVAGFTVPRVYLASAPTQAGIGTTVTSANFYGWHGGGYFRCGLPALYMEAVVLQSDSAFNVENAFVGGYPIIPAIVGSRVGGRQGFLGRLPDTWVGMAGLVEGRTYPNDGTRQLVQFGTVVFPWDGTIPVLQ
jgi:hypothetical protein